MIGMQLDLSVARLNIIEHDNYHKAEPCCNAMLQKWLEVDTTASWGKLFTVIDSLRPTVSSVPDKGDWLCIVYVK